MQVEITKMVYQHPWYVSSTLNYSNGRLESIYKPHGESNPLGTKPSFLLLIERYCRPDRTRPIVPTVGVRVLLERTTEFGHC